MSEGAIVTATTGAQPWELEAHVDDVADSVSPACWTVQETAWKDLVPELSDEVIALIAPSVVVSAESFGAPTVPLHIEPVRAVALAAVDAKQRMVTPSLPRRFRRRATG
jgi:hypothetical protein